MTAKNPTEIRVITPKFEGVVEDVRTWWFEGADLVVEKNDEDRTTLTFPLGTVVHNIDT